MTKGQHFFNFFTSYIRRRGLIGRLHPIKTAKNTHFVNKHPYVTRTPGAEMGNAITQLVGSADEVECGVVEDQVHKKLSSLSDSAGKIKVSALQSAFSEAVAEATHRFEDKTIQSVLADSGILQSDPRLKKVLAEYDEGGDGLISSEQEWNNIRQHSLLIDRAMTNDLIVPDFKTLKQDIQAIYDEVLPDRSGANADYIPQLSEEYVDPEQFGVSVCTIDGQRHSVGDSKRRFGIQSMSKAISYCIAQELHGPEVLHRHVGMEPSGRPFNDMCLNDKAHRADVRRKSQLSADEAKEFRVRPSIPHNPMINAGAIMTVSTLWRKEEISRRFHKIMEVWNKLVGHTDDNGLEAASFANAMYLSERSTASRNFCLAYMMEEAGAYMEGSNLHESLQLYFMCCSIELSCEMVSIVAATLANGGVNPLTGTRIFSQATVKNTLSLMGSCGMYDDSGEFAFTMGFPAKSGVGGGIMVVIPGVMGICSFSPRLDEVGNSARGVSFCAAFSRKFAFHNYDSLTRMGDKKYPGKRNAHAVRTGIDLLYAASNNECLRLTHLLFSGLDVNWSDYDNRTALHVAASMGHLDAVQKLIQCGADPALRDRFGATPLDDARRSQHSAVASYLATVEHAVAAGDTDQRLLALGSTDGLAVPARAIVDLLEKVGLQSSDKRLSKIIASLPAAVDAVTLDKMLEECDLIKRALAGKLTLQNYGQFRDRLIQLHSDVQGNQGGTNADYIPELAEQDPNKWGVALCSIDGQRVNIGDTKDEFCVQSCSHAITYCMAVAEHGRDAVKKHIGREPSGQSFNALVLDRRVSPPVPHNPCVNAGAIMSCALVQSDCNDSEDRVIHCMKEYWTKLAGKSTQEASTRYDRRTYKSESATANRNRALAFLMSETGSFPTSIQNGKDLMENLEFYFKCCSIVQDAEAMSVIAATLANGGVCPITGESVFAPEAVRDCLSLVSSCGMYDYSGEFAFKIGFPAKSGVGGAILIIIPNVMGMCTWSPPLDHYGNSVRGLDFCHRLAKEFNFHIYDRLPSAEQKTDPTLFGGSNHTVLRGQVISAAAKGDLACIKTVHSTAGPALLSGGDYDNRTAFHLACAEGHIDVVQYLVENVKVDVTVQDRWGRTGFDDAAGNKALLSYLKTKCLQREM